MNLNQGHVVDPEQRSTSIKMTPFRRQTTFTKSVAFNRSRPPHKAAAAAAAAAAGTLRPRPWRNVSTGPAVCSSCESATRPREEARNGAVGAEGGAARRPILDSRSTLAAESVGV